ncbi:protein-glutamate O-methyltransferase CheR [Sporolactobacillus shoreicorticis]|uniref:protein-glutamate O-methyltransferase n=1 Tax=Sporolactobacillus shoreicorticis TaxID=1923877 RepID=A0ABW5S1X6_9BACL|nr:protein-glutamate O-methyltransferase CheR [Sporolactobacillus shoreicorticis]MCO7127032.1 protein-glutamate O-methyltransferase CheR [Sporolactobacillus shoreicorticis]
MSEAMEQDYEQFKSLFFQLTGINLSLYKQEQMKRRLNSLRIKREIPSFVDYAYQLKENKQLLDEILSRMTINVTEFFRNRPRWNILEHKIRELAAENKHLNIWSAACSTGEEPYSLAILCSKYMSKKAFSIMATDIDQKILNTASQGTYLEKAIENLTADERRHFSKKGLLFEVEDELRQTICFMKHDLLLDPLPGHFDIIVCRNVLIYFTEEGKKKIYQKLSDALKSDGILFVGSTEQIFSPAVYHLCSTETFFYQKTENNG